MEQIETAPTWQDGREDSSTVTTFISAKDVQAAFNYGETSGQTHIEGILQSNWPITFKSVKSYDLQELF